MNDVLEIGHRQICHWFAGLLVREINQTQFDAYLSGAADPLFEQLQTLCDVSAERVSFSGTLLEVKGEATPQLRSLAADFAALFLLDGPTSALPYASLYIGENGTMFGAPHQDMIARLADAGLSQALEANEPADHIAFMLDYLGRLLEADPSGQVAGNFVNDSFAPWIDSFEARVIAAKTEFQFYPVIVRVLCRYLRALKR